MRTQRTNRIVVWLIDRKNRALAGEGEFEDREDLFSQLAWIPTLEGSESLSAEHFYEHSLDRLSRSLVKLKDGLWSDSHIPLIEDSSKLYAELLRIQGQRNDAERVEARAKRILAGLRSE